MTPIALDAMGGDRAPTETVAGAVLAAADGVDVVLVGDEEILKRELEALSASLPIVHAPESIDMGARNVGDELQFPGELLKKSDPNEGAKSS